MKVMQDILQSHSIELLFEYKSFLEENAQFTIAIPTFNRSKLLKETIKSVLNQKYNHHFYIVIVDNCSAKQELDEAISFLTRLDIPTNVTLKFFSNSKNIGMFGNWNRCIDLCETPFISILNDDDLIQPEFLCDISRNLSGNMMLIVGTTSFHDRRSNTLSFIPFLKFQLISLFFRRTQILNFEDLFIGNPVKGSLGAVFKTELAKKLGGYKERYFPSSDYYFTYKFWKVYGVKRINKPLARYRWSENESLKLEVLKGFLINDEKIRNRMLLDKSQKTSLIYRNFLNRMIRLNICLYKKINPSFNPLEINLDRKFYRKNYFCFFIKIRLIILYVSIKLISFINLKR